MNRRSFLAGASIALTVMPARSQLRSPARWLENDGTPRIATEAFGASSNLRVWLVTMPMPLWREWWNLLPVNSEAPRLIDGLVHDYLRNDEIAVSVLVSGALRDDSKKRKLVARMTTVAPDGRADPPNVQDYFWEGMPFNRTNSVAVLEPVLGIGDQLGRSSGTWKLGLEVIDTLAAVSVSISQNVSVG